MADPQPRELSDEEARALGLAPRELSDEEAAALGLAEAPKPAAPERDGAVRFLTGDGQHSPLTRLMAPARSAAQVLTMGAADEIGGGLVAGLEHAGAAFGIGEKKPFKQRLADKIDEYRRLDREASEASPVGSAGGQVTSMLLPVGAIGNAVTTAGKVLTAGGMGALGGFLGSEGSATERLPGAAVGAGLGLGMGTVAAGKGGEALKYVKNPAKILELPGGRGAAAGGALGAAIGEPTAGAAAGAGVELAGRAGVAVARKAGDLVAKMRARMFPRAEPGAPVPAAAPEYPPSIPKVITEEWGEGAGLGLGTPKLTPAPAAKSAAAPGPEAFEPPAVVQSPKAPAEVKVPAKADEWSAQAAPALDAPKLARRTGKAAAKADQPGPEAFEPAAPAPAPKGDEPPANPLLEELKAKLAGRPQSGIPKEDRSTVHALTNIVSSQSRAGKLPGERHYPVEPDVAFKQYLAELPKSTGASRAQTAKALASLTAGMRNGGDIGELIYKARAAGVSDAAIMKAVGVKSTGKAAPPEPPVTPTPATPAPPPATPPVPPAASPSAARVPTSDRDLEELLRGSLRPQDR